MSIQKSLLPGSWWSGDTRSQDISWHNIDLILPEYSSFSTRGVNIFSTVHLRYSMSSSTNSSWYEPHNSHWQMSYGPSIVYSKFVLPDIPYAVLSHMRIDICSMVMSSKMAARTGSGTCSLMGYKSLSLLLNLCNLAEYNNFVIFLFCLYFSFDISFFCHPSPVFYCLCLSSFRILYKSAV